VGEEPLLLVTETGEIVREVARSRIRNRLVVISTKAGEFFSFQPFSDDPLVAIPPRDAECCTWTERWDAHPSF
jgi:hypothetical protein